MRKIRELRDAFPHRTDIVKLYLKFRRIIRDGERLQKNRDELAELVFQRRLKRLNQLLADLLQWPNPDNIIEEIIKKVKRQQPRILTFVEYPDVPFHNNYAEYLIRIGGLKRKIFEKVGYSIDDVEYVTPLPTLTENNRTDCFYQLSNHIDDIFSDDTNKVKVWVTENLRQQFDPQFHSYSLDELSITGVIFCIHKPFKMGQENT